MLIGLGLGATTALSAGQPVLEIVVKPKARRRSLDALASEKKLAYRGLVVVVGPCRAGK